MRACRNVLGALVVALPSIVVASIALAQAPGGTQQSDPAARAPSAAAPSGVQQMLHVGDMQRFNAAAGEAQSTVVPPGVKPAACPQGRLLVSIDLRRPPTQGLVLGRNLDNFDTADPVTDVAATFDLPPNPNDYAYGTNDHDLLALPNGDVLYLTGAFSRRPLTPKPAWFDVAYRGQFGPGARSNLMVWRSTDCGSSFRFVSEFDPAQVGDRSCALPQFPRTTTPPGSEQRPVFDMGGSDGQLVQVDRATGHLFLTFQCVGFQQDTAVQDHFELSSVRLNRTLLAGSTDGGTSWRLLGTIPVASWRFGIVPLNEGRTLALGVGTTVTFARRDPQGNWSIDATGSSVPGATWGWDASFYDSTKIPKDRIGANIWASTIVAKLGVGGVLLTFPTTLKGGSALGHGYRLFSYEPSTKRFSEGRAVAPSPANAENVAMHLAAIDQRGGFPVLLYWTDIDSASRTATIRGRLAGVGDGPISADFDIARQSGSSAKWNLDQASGAYWYGDYHTGSGYHVRRSVPAGVRAACVGCIIDTYKFYPIWVQPDGTVRFTEVDYTRIFPPPVLSEDPLPGPPPVEESLVGEAAPDGAESELGAAALGPVELVPQVVPMNAVPRGPVEREEIEEYGERARELHLAPPERQ
jgi:hypothetical protein